MRNTIAVIAALGALIGGAILLNLGEAVPVSELRPARVPCDKIVKEDCPAGVIEAKDFCLCLTNKETLPDEESTVPVAKRINMVVCEMVDDETKQKHLATRYVPAALPLDGNCTLILDDIKFPGLSFHNVSTGIEARLEERCGFTITPDSWACCPSCLKWQAGCPTHRQLCKYGEDWKSHEDEVEILHP